MFKKKVTLVTTLCLVIALIFLGIWYFKPEKGTFYNLSVYDKFKNNSFTSVSYNGKQIDLNNDRRQQYFDYLNEFNFKKLSKKDLKNSPITQTITFIKEDSPTILRISILKNNGISFIFSENNKNTIYKEYSLDKPIDLKKVEQTLGF